ncbi:MAG: small multi-drug export protein [Oscillibacter sp.]|nr:small multi-drug export protein [Oscillibacter sp.]
MPFLDTLFGKLLLTFGTAMVPVIELRGAIPAGIAAGLPPMAAYITAVIGNLIPVPFIMLLIRQVFALLRRVPVLNEKIDWLEKRAHLKGRVVRKYRLPGLIILVGIPLPGTGAWTGALVAALLDIRLRDALPAILLGLIIAGGITTAVTMGVIHLF